MVRMLDLAPELRFSVRNIMTTQEEDDHLIFIAAIIVRAVVSERESAVVRVFELLMSELG